MRVDRKTALAAATQRRCYTAFQCDGSR